LNRLFKASTSYHSQVESQLLTQAAWFLFFYAAAISLSPAARLHSWEVTYRWDHWIGYGVWLASAAIIFYRLNHSLPDRDPFILPLIMTLCGWGLLEVWRLSAGFGVRQTIWLAVCLTTLFFLSARPIILDLLRRYKYLWLAGGLALTALTFFIGTYPGGSGPHLWLGLFGMYLQPSEPLKLLLIIYLAAYLADLRIQRLTFFQWLMPALIILAASLLILLAQRDLGTATIFILIFAFIVYLATGRRRVILICLLAIAAAGLMGYQLFDVIRVRVDAWINPWLDPSGRSYQIVQSIIAVASGGVFGRGPGLGSPGLIPVAQSDFIFAAISEETGLVGTIGLLTIISLLFTRGIKIALYASDTYRRNLAAGISIYLAIQSIFIVGGNLRLLPLSGVTLPFVSYGGSSLLTGFVAAWILLSISDQSEKRVTTTIRIKPYIISVALILTGILAAALVNGWWSVFRSASLSGRVDNPRRSIAERYVRRGALVDRSGQPITMSMGTPGEFTREYLVPGLAATTGYSHPVYGLSGLEQAYDDYLRGVDGNPSLLIWSNQLLYGQPPTGLDIRLSIDSFIQKLTDQALSEKKAAAIVLNAQTGEILAISSQPGFDPNTLDENWLSWTTRVDSPLMNRVTQGSYPVGTAITPFILSAQSMSIPFNTPPARISLDGFGCALPISENPSWSEALTAGCAGAVDDLLNHMPQNDMKEIYRLGGFFTLPDLPLPQAAPSSLQDLQRKDTLLGNSAGSATPLQMGLAAASISSGGTRPSPRIAMAVDTSAQGWVILPAGKGTQVYSAEGLKMALTLLKNEDTPTWSTTASVPTSEGQIHWFVGGTTPDWQGTSLAVAIVVENGTAESTQRLGRDLLNAIMMK
jgi:cell division protein FtsW (lipid II flippase)